MEAAIDGALLLLAKAAAAIRARVQAARERDLARTNAARRAVDEREAKREETDP